MRTTAKQKRGLHFTGSPLKRKREGTTLLEILGNDQEAVLPAFMSSYGETEVNIMQKRVNKASTQCRRGSIGAIRKARREFVRKPQPVRKRPKKEITPIISPGLFALKVESIPLVTLVTKEPDFAKGIPFSSVETIDKAYDDLHPAYLRFTHLAGVEPLHIERDGRSASRMHGHLQQVLTDRHDLDIYWDCDAKKYHFAYLTFQRSNDWYNVLFYQPVKRQLNGSTDKKYLDLFEKALATADKKLRFMNWRDIQDYVLEWDEFDEGRYEDEDVDYEKERFYKVQHKYRHGKAAAAYTKVFQRTPVLTERDIKRAEKYDSAHPIPQFARAIYHLAAEGKDICDYSEVIDEDDSPYLLYHEQFAIYYDLDEFFESHEEYVNNVAQEGPQEPRLVTIITDDMEEIPNTIDDFPEKLSSFFHQFCDLEEKLRQYKAPKEHKR